MLDDAYDQLPREENLVRLYELQNAIAQRCASRAGRDAVTEAERHRQEFGHVLAFGCCRDVDVAV